MDETRELLDEYADLVKKIVHSTNYSYKALDTEDLTQIANLAVLRAVKAYDPSCGTNIRSFVANAVRQDVYREAARFLGVLTVSFHTTRAAAKVSKLADSGLSDAEIAEQLEIKLEEVKNLRSAYKHKDYLSLDDESLLYSPDYDISFLLESVIKSPEDEFILNNRLLSKNPIQKVMDALNISKQQAYNLEASLKSRIARAIDEVI